MSAARIVRARIFGFRLPLVRTLRTAHGSTDTREGRLLELQCERAEERWLGYGEATPIPGFGVESLRDIDVSLRDLASQLVGRAAPAPTEHAQRTATHEDAPQARFAIDTALRDIDARRQGISLSSALVEGGESLRSTIRVNSLIAASTPDAIAQEARQARAAGYRDFKLKVATASVAEDRLRVAALREAVGVDARIRVDANGGWSLEQAREMLLYLAKSDVALCEQPVATTDELATLRHSSPIPIAADESADTSARAEDVIARGAADVIVLKPALLGSFHAARRIAQQAADAGIACYVTSLIESSVGVTAALALAASLPGSLEACGLATAGWLRFDLADAPRVIRGEMQVPTRVGLGVAPTSTQLERLRYGLPWERHA